jgi:hypothetical protein
MLLAALMAVKHLAVLNKYTSFKGRQISLTAQAARGICLSSQLIFFHKKEKSIHRYLHEMYFDF